MISLHGKRAALAALLGVTAAMALTAGPAFASRANASSGSGPLTVAGIDPFTGPLAFIGPSVTWGCKAGTYMVNQGGGVLGHHETCKYSDDKGDPADAVPVANHVLAFEHPTMLIGPGNELPSVLPIYVRDQVPDISVAGDPRYDHFKSDYLWRMVPGDSAGGNVLAWYARKHYKRVVSIFTNDPAAQTEAQSFIKKFRKLGGQLKVITVSPAAASYSTQVASALAFHPQALVGELDQASAATFFSNWLQQAPKLPTFVSDQDVEAAGWFTGVAAAVGGATLARHVVAVAPESTPKGPALTAYEGALKKTGTSLKQGVNGFVAAYYDGITVFSLAMDIAHSTAPTVYVKDIPQVTSKKKGAVIVHTYAEGLKALQRHKQIQYVGVGGQLVFNEWHDVLHPYRIATSDANGIWSQISVAPSSASNS